MYFFACNSLISNKSIFLKKLTCQPHGECVFSILFPHLSSMFWHPRLVPKYMPVYAQKLSDSLSDEVQNGSKLVNTQTPNKME